MFNCIEVDDLDSYCVCNNHSTHSAELRCEYSTPWPNSNEYNLGSRCIPNL